MSLHSSLVRPASLLTYAFASFLAFGVPATHLQAQGADRPDYVLVSAPLVLEDKLAVPGKVLAAGKYSIRIVDRFSDRYILRVDDSEGNAKVTFIGLHNTDLDPLAQHPGGPILWSVAPKDSTVTMRGFSFPDGNTLEFAYPKAEAVALAKANGYSVVAIDPESEGRKPDPKLTPEDREVVTLWMLTPTRIGTKQQTPAMEAKRFLPAETAPKLAPTKPDTTLIARNEPPEELTAAGPVTSGTVTDAVAAPIRAPRVKTRRFAARLPQTGSYLPLVALLSALMLAAAGSVRVARSRV